MPKLILCEGRTDAILISYYLKKTEGWGHIKEKDSPRLLAKTKDNEEVNWYKKNGEFLCIFACGGIDNVPRKLGDAIELNQDGRRETDIFNRVVVLIDHDSRTEAENITTIQGWIRDAAIMMNPANFRLQQWCNATYQNQQKKEQSLDILPMILPLADAGNLESFLLNAIRMTDAESERVVNQSQVFIDGLAAVTSIQKHRYKGKAQLGAVLSIFSPEWVFTDLDVRLTAIDWTQYETVNTAFAVLKSI